MTADSAAARRFSDARAAQAQEPSAAHAVADVAAWSAQPHRARPYRRRRAGTFRAAAMPRLRNSPISAPRGLSKLPLDSPFLDKTIRIRRTARDHGPASQQRSFFP